MGRMVKRFGWLCVGVAGLALAGWGVLARMRSVACQSETLAERHNIAGADFQIVDTNCDTLAKDESVSVYVSEAADRQNSLLKWKQGRTLLFKYDPGSPDTPLASIREVGANRVVISVPRVSSVLLKNQRWKNLSVEYEIGHVDYP